MKCCARLPFPLRACDWCIILLPCCVKEALARSHRLLLTLSTKVGTPKAQPHFWAATSASNQCVLRLCAHAYHGLRKSLRCDTFHQVFIPFHTLLRLLCGVCVVWLLAFLRSYLKCCGRRRCSKRLNPLSPCYLHQCPSRCYSCWKVRLPGQVVPECHLD